MQNLIENATWQQANAGVPEQFALQGPFTYDALEFDGYRTISLTMAEGQASINYLPKINVSGMQMLSLGLIVRAVKVDEFLFAVQYFTADGESLAPAELDVADQIGPHFRKIIVKFPVPENAATAAPSILIAGEGVAVTMYAPEASVES